MVWSKVPSAATAIACAACIAAASALPGAEMEADHVAKTVTGDVKLSALTDLAWLSGIQAFLNLPTQGLQAFVPSATTTPPQAGYAALSGLASYQQLFSTGPTALGGIDAFSALPNLLSGDLTSQDAFNAIPLWQSFLTTGDTSSTGLGGIDAFSAIPNWQSFVTSLDLTKTGLGGIAAFSALGALLDPPATPAAAPKTAAPLVTGIQTPLVKSAPTIGTPRVFNRVATALANLTAPAVTGGTSGQQADTPNTPSLPVSNKSSLPTGKRLNGSYSGVFKPSNNSVLLFGSGGGGNADNGIRGWGKVISGIKGALGGSKSGG
jgi:hypothetical protein